MDRLTRRDLLKRAGQAAAAGATGLAAPRFMLGGGREAVRPNLLFILADDWSYPHAGACGDPFVSTVVFDEIAKRGVLLSNCVCHTPSCSPARSTLLSGQITWRLGEAIELRGDFARSVPDYVRLLKEAGYHTGCWYKGWGPPGKTARAGRDNRAGTGYDGFKAFLDANGSKPFCFWLGSSYPHRGNRPEGDYPVRNKRIDMVPPFLPNAEPVQGDMKWYYACLETMERQEIAPAFELLEQRGLLENTIVVYTGDNGMPFPRAKAQLYEYGIHVPMAAMWEAGGGKGGRTVDDLVGFHDLAPTFLEAAGIEAPGVMTGRSLLPLLRSGKAGQVDPSRSFQCGCFEKHGWRYPMRCIRTADHLYIWNVEPDLWPAGDPAKVHKKSGLPVYQQYDGGPSKSYLIEHRNDPGVKRFADLAFAKRLADELYDIRRDPGCLTNLAGRPGAGEQIVALRKQLADAMSRTRDPRAEQLVARL